MSETRKKAEVEAVELTREEIAVLIEAALEYEEAPHEADTLQSALGKLLVLRDGRAALSLARADRELDQAELDQAELDGFVSGLHAWIDVLADGALHQDEDMLHTAAIYFQVRNRSTAIAELLDTASLIPWVRFEEGPEGTRFFIDHKFKAICERVRTHARNSRTLKKPGGVRRPII